MCVLVAGFLDRVGAPPYSDKSLTRIEQNCAVKYYSCYPEALELSNQ